MRFGSRLGFGGYAGLSEAMAGAASQRLSRQGGAGRAAPHGHLLDRWLSACLGDLEATRSAVSDELIDAVATLLLASDGRTYVSGSASRRASRSTPSSCSARSSRTSS